MENKKYILIIGCSEYKESNIIEKIIKKYDDEKHTILTTDRQGNDRFVYEICAEIEILTKIIKEDEILDFMSDNKDQIVKAFFIHPFINCSVFTKKVLLFYKNLKLSNFEIIENY